MLLLLRESAATAFSKKDFSTAASLAKNLVEALRKKGDSFLALLYCQMQCKSLLELQRADEAAEVLQIMETIGTGHSMETIFFLQLKQEVLMAQGLQEQAQQVEERLHRVLLHGFDLRLRRKKGQDE